MGITLKALVMSAFESHAPWSALWIRVIAWSMDVYFMEKSGAGMMLLMLGMGVPWEEERSIINLFFPEYFLGAMPMVLIVNGENGGSLNGLIINPSWTSFAINALTGSGSMRAYRKLWEI